MPTLNEILAEANLSEAQVEQIAGLIKADRAELREKHMGEIQALTESKDAAIAELVRAGLEQAKQLDESRQAPPSDDAVQLIEQRVQREARQEARKMLVEALAPYRNQMRALRHYSALTNLVESLQNSFAAVMGESVFAAQAAPATPAAQLNESVQDQAGADLALAEARVAELESEVLGMKKEQAFTTSTVHLAETSKAKVRAIVDATNVTTLEEFNVVLAAAVTGVKPSQKEAQTQLDEGNQNSGSKQPGEAGKMGSYLAALGQGRRAK